MRKSISACNTTSESNNETKFSVKKSVRTPSLRCVVPIAFPPSNEIHFIVVIPATVQRKTSRHARRCGTDISGTS